MLSENLWFHNIYCFLYTGDTAISGCSNATGLLPESLNWMPYYIAGFSMVLVLINNGFNILNADPFWKDVTTGVIIFGAVALTAGRKR